MSPSARRNDDEAVRLVRQLHGLCRQEFNAEELESEQLWLDRLDSDNDAASFASFSFALAVERDESTNTTVVVGGATLEYYSSCSSGLLGFVVVDRRMQGRGIAQKVVQEATAELQRMAAKHRTQLQHVFIDVAQARDAAPADAAFAAVRQKIWTKMGFVPLQGCDLVHPGAFGHGRYHLCVLRQQQQQVVEVSFATIVEFLRCYYASSLVALDYENNINSNNIGSFDDCENGDEQQQQQLVLPQEFHSTVASFVVNSKDGEEEKEFGVVLGSAEFWM